MAEGWPTEHTEHTEEFLTGGNGEGGGRRSGRGQRAERTARPKPTGWKARATWHGLSSPCRGDRGSRRSRIAAHAI